jgi:hypothetical protein
MVKTGPSNRERSPDEPGMGEMRIFGTDCGRIWMSFCKILFYRPIISINSSRDGRIVTEHYVHISLAKERHADTIAKKLTRIADCTRGTCRALPWSLDLPASSRGRFFPQENPGNGSEGFLSETCRLLHIFDKAMTDN